MTVSAKPTEPKMEAQIVEPTGAAPRVAAVVPAYNEESRIGVVLDVLLQVETVDEVIVVDDGSSDGTAEEAARFDRVSVIASPVNGGKGAAMQLGAAATDAPCLLFIDADLVGLRVDHVEDMLRPLLAEQAEMVVGIFSKGRLATDLSHTLFPFVSGQRAMNRSLLEGLDLSLTRYGVEVAITKHVKSKGVKVVEVLLPDATHVMKEEKLGFGRGFYARLLMYRDIARSYAHHVLQRRRRRLEARNR